MRQAWRVRERASKAAREYEGKIKIFPLIHTHKTSMAIEEWTRAECVQNVCSGLIVCAPRKHLFHSDYMKTSPVCSHFSPLRSPMCVSFLFPLLVFLFNFFLPSTSSSSSLFRVVCAEKRFFLSFSLCSVSRRSGIHFKGRAVSVNVYFVCD